MTHGSHVLVNLPGSQDLISDFCKVLASTNGELRVAAQEADKKHKKCGAEEQQLSRAIKAVIEELTRSDAEVKVRKVELV